MLVVSDLQKNVKRAFYLLEKWNIVPFSSPFCISTNIKPGTYAKFQANSAYQWKNHVSILIVTTFLGFYKLLAEGSKLEDKVLNIWKIGFFLQHIYFAWFYHQQASGIAEFFNQLSNFERRYQGHGHIDSKFIKFLVERLLSNIHGNSFIFSTAAFVIPATSWGILPIKVFGYTQELWPDLHTITNFFPPVNIIERLFSFLVTYVVWRIVCNLGILSVIISMLVSTFCLHATLDLFKTHIINRQSTFQTTCKIYREIQLICGLYNEYHKHTIQFGFVLMAPLTLAISSFLVISRWQVLSSMALVIFLNFVVTMAAIIMLIFRYAVKVHTSSKLIRKVLCRRELVRLVHTEYGKRRLNLKYWKSMVDLKVYFGGSNFFDRITCLVLLDFSIGLAINLILISV